MSDFKFEIKVTIYHGLCEKNIHFSTFKQQNKK